MFRSRARGLTRFTLAAVLISIGAATLVKVTLPPNEATAESLPNIVVIQADDLDKGSLNTAAYLPDGPPELLMTNYRTFLADVGITFNKAFVSQSMCCPSRATFLTGQYAHNNGVRTNFPPEGGCHAFEPHAASTLATWLTATYATGIIGKYLNEYGCAWDDSCLPSTDRTHVCAGGYYEALGWDQWHVLVGNAQKQLGYSLNDEGQINTFASTHQYLTLQQRAASFIAQAPEPFFLYVAPTAPHLETGEPSLCDTNFGPTTTIRFPSDGSLDHAADDIALPQADPFNELVVVDKPQHMRDIRLMDAPGYSGEIACTERVYRDRLESLQGIDSIIGAMAGALSGRGASVLNNTVVFFTSDNAFYNGEHRLHQKRLPYEDGIKVPLVVRYKDQLVQRPVDDLVVNTDLAPTILKLAGFPDTFLEQVAKVDGQSLVPFLTNSFPPGWTWRKRFLLEHWPDAFVTYPRFFGIRTGPTDTSLLTPNVLYVEHGEPWTEREYYDLDGDPGIPLPADPNEMTNALFPGSTFQPDSDYTSRLDDLKDCGRDSGETSCQSLENLP